MSGTPSDNPTMTPPPMTPISPVWEDESRPVFDRWKETVIAVMSAPTAFFDAMRQEGGIVAPLIFAVIGGWVGSAAGQIWGFIGSALHIPFMTGGNFFQTLCGVVIAPVGVAIGLFIGSGIVHLCLMVVGGAKRPFETTFRVVAYIGGTTGLLGIVPVCGALVGGIWAIVLCVIGMSRAHRITTGKALIAVLIPVALALACLGVVIVGGAMVGMAVLRAAH